MANPAVFEYELRVVFGRFQHKLTTYYSFNNVKVISPLFRYSSKPVAAPILPFPGLDDALLKYKALRRPNYSCDIKADNIVYGGI